MLVVLTICGNVSMLMTNDDFVKILFIIIILLLFFSLFTP